MNNSKFNKILVVGSDSIHVVNFINLIKEFFNEVIYVGDYPIKLDIIKRQYQINYRSINPFKQKQNIKELQQIIVTENPDIIHIQQINRLAYLSVLANKKTKKPIIATAWGSDVLLMPKKNSLFKTMVNKVLKEATYITVDSQNMITEINRLVCPKNSPQQVLFGIDPILPSKKEKIIYSNRLHEPLYSIDVIIDEFYQFQENHKDWKLVIGANGSLTQQLKEQVRKIGLEKKIEFIGWVTPEINNKYYAKSSIFISIPKSDGTAVSLLEAMSAGCVPIVANLPVSKEWITDKENGIIFNTKQNNFEMALQLNPLEVARENQQIINEKATKDVATNKYLEVYNSVLIE